MSGSTLEATQALKSRWKGSKDGTNCPPWGRQNQRVHIWKKDRKKFLLSIIILLCLLTNWDQWMFQQNFRLVLTAGKQDFGKAVETVALLYASSIPLVIRDSPFEDLFLSRRTESFGWAWTAKQVCCKTDLLMRAKGLMCFDKETKISNAVSCAWMEIHHGNKLRSINTST